MSQPSSFSRRRAATRIAAITAALCVPLAAHSADYPTRPVRVVVPYSPGGATDVAARLVSNKLNGILGQSFVVDNRAGATGTIGTNMVVRSEPDGYTLLANDTTYAMLPSLFTQLPWDHAKGLVPITTLMTTPMLALVPANSRFKTLADLLDYARANPGKLNFGSGGSGSSIHLAAELMNSQAKVSMTHVPYKGGGDAMAALVSGQIDMLMEVPATAVGQIAGGKVRALAISSTQRLPLLPDVPTFAQSGMPDYKVTSWFGMSAPQGTSPEIVAKLRKAIQAALAEPDVRRRIDELGAQPGGIESADYAAMIVRDTQLWGGVAKKIGLQPQ
ncbi:Bug family tripartite tricarboxylate transporter substrate binding protein [Variovorax sp. Root411]|uniref:Bug family tripartite tricarboxylate transporter substrate binding protein n=1 Tax=Variovorax sp. Root411 TaxID=1736530 RepID=UPI0006F6671B|nr:tripartite tricarboxylate transporter substrate binding protein [Variovorax sp. Root411]KQW56426.1 ABC transporter substrate-binding protein [Variovorax sp. Root411]